MSGISKAIGRFVGRLSKTRDVEYNSGVPVESQTGIKPLSMEEIIRMHVRNALSEEAVNDGNESFEDADDFEEEDPDVMPMTHHQVVAMTDQELRGVAAGYGIDISDMASGTVPGAGSTGGQEGETTSQPATPP